MITGAPFLASFARSGIYPNYDGPWKSCASAPRSQIRIRLASRYNFSRVNERNGDVTSVEGLCSLLNLCDGFGRRFSDREPQATVIGFLGCGIGVGDLL